MHAHLDVVVDVVAITHQIGMTITRGTPEERILKQLMSRSPTLCGLNTALVEQTVILVASKVGNYTSILST